MRSLSRREFFLNLGHNLVEQIDSAAIKKVLAGVIKSESPAAKTGWVSIGRIATFIPGVFLEVKVSEQKFFIKSTAEGFWIECKDKKKVALRIDSLGTAWVDTGVEWPANRMLSHLTGEQIEIELQEINLTTGEGK